MKTPFNNGPEPFDPMVQDCWHYYSDGTSQCELLLNDADGIYISNILGITSNAHCVSILCFEIMTTNFQSPKHRVLLLSQYKRSQRKYFFEISEYIDVHSKTFFSL